MVLQKLKAKFIDKLEITMGRFEEGINVWPQTILYPVWPKEVKVKSSVRGEMPRKAPDSDFRKSRVRGAWFDSVHCPECQFSLCCTNLMLG